MKKENKSFLVHIAAGIAAGILSFFLENQALAFLVMVIIAAVLVKTLDKVLGKEKFKWWLSNGLWMISWIALYNV